jgi:hypothetical protein
MKSSCSVRSRAAARLFLFAFVFFTGAPSATAQTITETQQLSFGNIVVTDSASGHSLVLSPGGAVNFLDPAIYIIDPPQAGEYNFIGGTPNTQYDITFSNSIILLRGATTFTVDDFVAQPATITTDGAGDASFSVGATLTTDTGPAYADGNYSGSLDITITVHN